MSRESQTERFSRILRVCLYLHQHGGSASELAALAGCTERTVHRDLAVIKKAGVNIVVALGRYHIASFPEIQKLECIPEATKNCPPVKPSNIIFRKWYTVEARGGGENGHWYVVRADQQTSKGTRVGPIQIQGKSWYQVAAQQANERNRAVLRKREEITQKLKDAGWSAKAIQQLKDEAKAEARAEMGQDYKEAML